MSKKRKSMTDAERKAKGLGLAEKHTNTALAALERLTKTISKYGADAGTKKVIVDALEQSTSALESAFEGKKTASLGVQLT